jgi:type IV pilus assembly protein PilA
MNTRLRVPRTDREDGFSMIELAVVILIIGILISLAIPSFLLVRKSTQNRQAQTTLRKFLISAIAEAASDEGSYLTASATAVSTNEPGSRGIPGNQPSLDQFTVSVNNQDMLWSAATLSRTGECFYIKDTKSGGTLFGRTKNLAVNACDGNTGATLATNTTW